MASIQTQINASPVLASSLASSSVPAFPPNPSVPINFDSAKTCPTCKRKFIPQLPTEVLRIIFKHFEMLEDDPFIQQKRWVILSLVCKKWTEIIIPLRKTIILATADSIRSFSASAPALLASGVAFRHLTYNYTDVSESVLNSLALHLSKTVTSITVPLLYLRAPHFSTLVKTGRCSQITVNGKNMYGKEDKYGSEYWGNFWHYAQILHSVSTLSDLTLSHDRCDSSDATTVVTSPITRLHLHDISFDDLGIAQRFVGAFTHPVQHLVLTRLPAIEDGPLCAQVFWEAFGGKLLSLKIDSSGLYSEFGDLIEAEELFLWLPVLESLDLNDKEFIQWKTLTSSRVEYFVDLPRKLKYCAIGQITWEHARALIQNLADDTYLPSLSSPLIIELIPHRRKQDRKQDQQRIREYEETLSKTGGFDSIRYVSFNVRWTLESEHKPFTFT